MFKFKVTENKKLTQKCEFSEYETLKTWVIEAWSGLDAINKVKQENEINYFLAYEQIY